jgi:hypothetical protein
MNKKIVKYYIIIVITLLFGNVLFAQTLSPVKVDSVKKQKRYLKLKNSEGKEFWLCFQRNYKNKRVETPQTRLHLELFITGDEDARVTIEIAGIGYKKKISIPGGTIRNVKLPPQAQVYSNEIKEKLAVHITSDNPISVYGLNRRFQTTDTYLGLPVNVLGTEYRVMGYDVSEGLMSHFAIVATENGTEVTIVPSTNTMTHKAGVPYKIRMDRGEVYQVAARNDRHGKCDITGTYIKSNKKISVFGGHQCAYVPSTIMACNHLVEQMPPLPSWGKHFYLGMLKPRSNYTFRVLANEPDTRVFLNAKLIKILRAGEHWDSTVSRNVQVTANKPILVAQYSQGFKNGDSIGDPMMILVSPTQQFLNEYRFATPINGSWRHNINIVVPNKGISSMRLDGRAIDRSMFEQLGISRYSIATITVPYGSHYIKGDLPFGMYTYGLGYGNDSYDAYGTMGGQSFIEYEPAADTLPPMADDKDINGQHIVVVRDDRVDDSGIKEIKILDNIGLDFQIPNIQTGTPQVPIVVSPFVANTPGRVVFRTKDIALNEATFTLCYFYDEEFNVYRYALNEGVVDDCMPDQGIQLGLFGKLVINSHSADFSSSGDVRSKGIFNGSAGVGGYGGIYVGRRLSSSWTLSARISFENYPGTLEAPDSVPSKIRQEDGSLIDFQESKTVKLNGISSTLALAGEYYFRPNTYFLAGINLGFQLSNAIDYKSKILIPQYYTYENGEREIDDPSGISEMNSLNSFRFGILLGAGLSIPVSYNISVFSEIIYNIPVSSMIEDGSWRVHQFGLQIGGKFRIL